ncbi:hypothetical protein BH11BAC3_BH11BAC3_12820 [soil metagenome]
MIFSFIADANNVLMRLSKISYTPICHTDLVVIGWAYYNNTILHSNAASANEIKMA